MSRVRWAAAGAIGLAAWAASVAVASPPKVIEIRVPEPTPPPPPPPPPIGPDGQPLPVPAPTASGPRAPMVREGVRREVRKVEGEPATALHGRYEVVEVTENGETEDYRIKMEREGKALAQDCVTVRLVFDFGSEAGLPALLQIAEQQQCHKGGLGVYASELALALQAGWTTGEATRLSLPEMEAHAMLVRVRKPEGDELHTPSHWLGPENRTKRPAVEYTVVAEKGPAPRPAKGAAGPPPEAPIVAIHLIAADGSVLHLEPEPPDSPFVR